MTIQECAQNYNVSESAVRYWIQRGYVDAHKDENGRWVIDDTTVPPNSYSVADETKKSDEEEHKITLNEVFEKYGYSKATVQSWIYKGIVKATKDDRGRWIVDEKTLPTPSERTKHPGPLKKASYKGANKVVYDIVYKAVCDAIKDCLMYESEEEE